jgi:hypothetical protein
LVGERRFSLIERGDFHTFSLVSFLFGWFAVWAVKHLHFGVGRDAEYGGLGLEANQPVEASFEFARWPVHENNRRAITHMDDAAEFAVDPHDVVYAKPEWLLSMWCDKAGELGLLAWLFHDASRILSDVHCQIVSR